MFGFELIVEVLKRGGQGAFFTLEYTQPEALARFERIGGDRRAMMQDFLLDTSDDVCADYIVKLLSEPGSDMIVVVDYLQLLDQRRHRPSLESQVSTFKRFARTTGVIIVILSQVDRAFTLSGRAFPGLDDVRLPNPLNLGRFDKACFMNQGKMQLVSL